MANPMNMRGFDRRRFLAGAIGTGFGLRTTRKSHAGEGGRPRNWIGYTEGRNDLPGGQFFNWITNRACAVRADGTERRFVAEELAGKPNTWTQFAGWSPDGRTAVVGQFHETPENAAWEREHKTFRMTEGWLADICLMDFPDGAIRNLSAIERVSDYNTGLIWLPGGGYGFTPLIQGVSKPYVMDADGHHKRDVSGGGKGFAYGYGVSPDGRLIAYHEDYKVRISNVDGTAKITVNTGLPFEFAPQWSPDGKHVLFVAGEHYDCHPHIVRKDGTGLRKLADRGGYKGVVEKLKHPDFHSESSDIPVWSPDAAWVYYTSKADDAIELMRVSTDGKTERLSHSKPGTRHYHPSVSPDGKWILFGSDTTGSMQLHVAKADGRDARTITQAPPGYGAMHGHWRPGPAA